MKKKEEEDKGKLDDMATKDTVKKDDEKKEEKPDTRGMYAKIAMIKNKLRSMGQANPMVIAVDACEERTPAKDDPAFDNMRKKTKQRLEATKGTEEPDIPSKPQTGPSKPSNKEDDAPSYNIPTADNPKGGKRKKSDPKSYPSGVGMGG